MKVLLVFLSSFIALSVQQTCLNFLGICLPDQNGVYSCPSVSPTLNSSDAIACLPNGEPGGPQCCEIGAQYANCQDNPICSGLITDPSKCSPGQQLACPLSCQTCDGVNSSPTPSSGTNSTCTDVDPINCPRAYAAGSCSQAFYQQNCPLSCKVCSASGGTPSGTPSATCVDSDPVNCPRAANMGSCTGSQASFYRQNCKKSCGVC
uniref:ShKT domain-containing protein n=1 Tax=Acrobeloides nanus TaxID=290746 RepID=A0A914DRQ9_9BILA